MICVSVDALDFDFCESLLRKHALIEFRLDRTIMSLKEIKELFAYPNRMIATCRPGKFENDKREELFKTAIDAGARYVDVEYETDDNFIKSIKSSCENSICKMIISYHNMQSTPNESELKKIIDNSYSKGADIVKVACRVNDDKDNNTIISLYSKYEVGSLIAIGLGVHGRITRIAAPFLGAPFTYASLERNLETAPGQIDVESLKKIFDLMK